MILVDTNVLVALVLRKDRLHRRAVRDLETLVRDDIGVMPSVVCEACFLLPSPEQRARVRDLLSTLRATVVNEPAWADVFAWLARYADHEPDWVDGCLVTLAERNRRVWTYDAEFRAVWRRRDGSPVPLATS